MDTTEFVCDRQSVLGDGALQARPNVVYAILLPAVLCLVCRCLFLQYFVGVLFLQEIGHCRAAGVYTTEWFVTGREGADGC